MHCEVLDAHLFAGLQRVRLHY
ncbi:hypothetical protein [Hymenobacter sp. GOD-10R]